MKIAELLDSYNSNTLWDMARAAQLVDTGSVRLKKQDLMLLMEEGFFQPQRIRAVYASLPAVEREVLNRLLLHDGQVSTRLFKRELVRAGFVTEVAWPAASGRHAAGVERRLEIYGQIVSHIGKPQDPQSTIFEDLLARLTLQGLVFSEEVVANSDAQSFKLQLHPGNRLFIPPVVRQHLPATWAVAETSWAPAHRMMGDPQLFLRNLYLYWDTVRRERISIIKSGYVGKTGLKSLNASLLTPDSTLEDARNEGETTLLHLLRQVLSALKLVEVRDGELQPRTKAASTIPELWQQPTVEQVRAIVAIWRTLDQPHLLRRHDLQYTFGADVRQGCHTLLVELAEIPAGAWLEIDLLHASLQDRNADFLFPARERLIRQRYYYSSSLAIGGRLDEEERNFLAQVGAGFLFQAGLVELGYARQSDEPTQWIALRLTPLGEAVLKQVPFDAPPSGQIIVQPNFQILALGPVPLHLLAQLDLFAERKKVDHTAFEYQLTRQSVYAAQQRGFGATEVAQFLTEISHHELSQNIQRSLREWGAEHDRIVFRTGVTLLQTTDGALLEKLLADQATGRHLARPVGDTVALVKQGRRTPLLEALRASGTLPALSGASPNSADKSVLVSENGAIRSLEPVPSLFVHGRLARFCAETATGWQLTEASVHRAGGSKEKAQRIIDELRRLHRGRLPEVIVRQVKAWGGYYGAAAAGEVHLFEFRDQEALAELCQLAELRELLQPFAAGNRALAVVAADQVAAVQAILAQLGIPINPISAA
ncbi:MAG: helicase-associated domain-containing protein, partial [Ardenticatenales bacterium]|nr:helicase-associated domain-containing protein [Ardenticatenales bacterium]